MRLTDKFCESRLWPPWPNEDACIMVQPPEPDLVESLALLLLCCGAQTVKGGVGEEEESSACWFRTTGGNSSAGGVRYSMTREQ